MVHTETSGRSTFHNLLGPEIPSLPICRGMFALFDCWGQLTLNPVRTECKQKRIFMLKMFLLYSHISKLNHILVITNTFCQIWKNHFRKVNHLQLSLSSLCLYWKHLPFITSVWFWLYFRSIWLLFLLLSCLFCHLSLCRSLQFF